MKTTGKRLNTGSRTACAVRAPLLAAVLLGGLAPQAAWSMAGAGTGPAAERELREQGWLAEQIRNFRAYPHLYRAYHAIGKNRYSSAEAELREYLELHPQDTRARMSFIHVLYQMKKLPEMLRQSEVLLQQDPDNMTGYLYRGMGKQAAGELAEAARSFRRVLENPGAARADRIYAGASAADLALRAQRYREALDALVVLRQLTDTYEVNFRRGVVLERLGRLDDARQAFVIALQQTASLAQRREVHAAIASSAIVRNRPDEAIRHGEAVLAIEPGNVHWLRTMANLHYQQKDYGAAEDYARRAAGAGGADEHLVLAHVLVARKDYQGAAAAFTAAAAAAAGTRDDTLRQKAMLGLGYAREAQGDEKAAREAFARAGKLNPLRAPAPDPHVVARALVARGQLDKAVRVFERALARGGDPGMRLQLADWYVSLGRHEKAAAALARFTPGNAQQRRWVSELHARLGNLEGAIAHLKPVARSDEARMQLAHYYVKAGQSGPAVEVLEALLRRRLDPALRVQALRQLGFLESQRGREREAIAAFEGAIAQGDRQPDIRLALGYLLAGQGRHEDALAHFDAVLAAGPSHPAALGAARMHAALGRPARALEYYSLAAQSGKPDSAAEQAAVLSEAGHLHSRMGDFAAARASFSEAARYQDSTALQLGLAYAEEKLGLAGDAVARLERLRVDDLDRAARAAAFERMAGLWERTGKPERARASMARALELAPSPERHYAMTLLALQQQDRPAARVHLEAAVDGDRENAGFRQQLGYVCRDLKDLACAASNLESAARLKPHSAALLADLGYTYTEAGDNARAVDAFKRSIDAAPGGGAAPEAQAERDRVWGLRQQVRDMSRRHQLNLYQSYRPDSRSAGSDVPPSFQTGGLIPSQGGVEYLYQPPGVGYQDGRTLRLFGRMLWSNRPDSAALESRTVQGGVGVEYKPLRDANLYVSLERLFKVGSQAQENWLARLSWSYANGYGMKPDVRSWNQTVAYADLGYLLQHENTRSAYLEVRQGRAFNYANRVMVTPHLTLAGRWQRPDPFNVSYLEGGAGVSVKVLFNQTRYAAPRSSAELFVQYRKPVHSRRSGGWLFGAALQF